MERFDQLLCDLLDGSLRQPKVILQNVEQFTLRILRYNTEITIGLESIKHENDVLMVQLAQNTDLLTKILDILFTFPVLVYKLHRHSKAGIFTPCLQNKQCYN